MKKFKYSARNHQGKLIKGVIYGFDKEECFVQLRTNNLYPVRLKQILLAREGLFNLSKTIKYAEMSIFCKQFSALIRAGIAIPQALKILRDQKGSPLLKKIIYDLLESLEQGQSLYQGVHRYEERLPQFFSPLIRAGEMTNSLDVVLEDLGIYYHQVDQFRKQISQLLVYPFILLISTLGVICFLFLKIIPDFHQIYSSLNAEMPLLTHCLMTISYNLSLYIKNYLIGCSVCVFSLSYIWKYLNKQNWFNQLQYLLPFWGSLRKKLLTARLARTLSLLLENGLEVLQAIELSRGSAGVLIDQFLIQTITRLRQGVSLTESLQMTHFFPEIFLEMTKVGEEAGVLGKMLAKVAGIFEEDTRGRIEKFVTVFEPILLMTLAIVVGLIVFAIMLPMFDLIKLF